MPPYYKDEQALAIKDKQKLYKAWVRSKLEEDYIKYILARRPCKRVVKEAKEESWKRYGEHLVSCADIHRATSTGV